MRFAGLLIVIILFGCNKKSAKTTLAYYLEENEALEQADLIACAANQSPTSSNTTYPTDVFFYPVAGSYNYRYFECEKLKDSANFSTYFEIELPQAPVFNGYLYRFQNREFVGERMAIVTYETNNTIHVCDPIRLKTNTKPTEFNGSSFEITENSINPSFTWDDGTIKENVIYFQVISDTLGNLISGTYTYDKTFTFYDLSNVVLNITIGTPELQPNSRYNVLLMGVSEDNWVNLVHERTFYTN